MLFKPFPFLPPIRRCMPGMVFENDPDFGVEIWMTCSGNKDNWHYEYEDELFGSNGWDPTDAAAPVWPKCGPRE